jgi:hypothetical protein
VQVWQEVKDMNTCTTIHKNVQKFQMEKWFVKCVFNISL